MRILVITHEYPLVGGGGGRVAQDLAIGFTRRGHQVRVITAHCGQLPEREEQEGVQIIRLRSARQEMFRASLGAMLAFVPAAFFSAWRMVKKWRPDVVHVHFAVPSGAAAWLLSKFTGVPYVLTIHLGDVPGGVPEKTGRWFRWVYPFTPPIWKKAAAIAAVSSYTRSLALKKYRVPIQVIPNGVDLETLNPGEIQVGTPPRVVFAGRMQPQKNPLLLVRCLAAVSDLPWSCTLLGDGPLLPAVKSEIGRLGLSARFDVPGWVSPEDVIEQFRHSDLLFMPSRSEGMPIVGLHALAMGLALVLSKVGGCVDLIEDEKNGFLLDPDDQSGFEQALHNLLSNPQRLLSFRKASREYAQKFNLKTIVSQYEHLLKEVVIH